MNSIARSLRHDDQRKPRPDIYNSGTIPRTPNLQSWSIVPYNLYVALLRVRDANQLKIRALSPSRTLCTLMFSLELKGLKNKPAFHTFPYLLRTFVLFPES